MVIAALVAALLTVATPGHSLKAADNLTIWDQSSFYDEDGENGEAENLYVKTDGEVANQLNITIERSPFERLTILDQVALMIYQLKHVHADWKPSSGIRLRFETDLVDLSALATGAPIAGFYKQDAKVGLTLRLEF
jgi:hypothetical protein